MFESLSERLSQIFRRLSGKGRLSEADVRAGLREIRQALLAADVHYQVVGDLLAQVESEALGKRVLDSLTPAQQLLGIVRREMAAIMGERAKLRLSGQPAVVLLVGPAGSGKTTTAGKLAWHLDKRGRRPILVCADPFRPAAAEQLRALADQVGAAFYPILGDPLEGTREALAEARRSLHDILIVDTPGVSPGETPPPFLSKLVQEGEPSDILLVLDALVGQEAAGITAAFLPLGVTGVVLTKLDGDARGGAALSLPALTGRPVVFVGVGERPDDLEPFHPERMADRILGLGDLAGLMERLEEGAGEELERTAVRAREGEFTLEDFLAELEAMGKAGSLSQLLTRIPGLGRSAGDPELEQEFIRTRAIIQSMTVEERRNPHIIGGSRKRRIALGSGTTVQEVNRLLAQYGKTRRLIRELGQRRLPPGWDDILKMR